MSDTSQGPGWWLASDGRWYPPETHPGHEPEPKARRGSKSLDEMFDAVVVDDIDRGIRELDELREEVGELRRRVEALERWTQIPPGKRRS
jgi:hypothetical protein